MLRQVYEWTLSLAASRHAVWALAVVSFVESSFFPIPPDALLVPMIIADRRRAWFYALVATASSVIGGFLGYAIGYFAFDTIGEEIVCRIGSRVPRVYEGHSGEGRVGEYLRGERS